MGKKCPKIIWIPCDLKARVKKLARLNGMTCSDLIRLSIEAKLPDYEAGRQPLKGIECRVLFPRSRPRLSRMKHTQAVSGKTLADRHVSANLNTKGI